MLQVIMRQMMISVLGNNNKSITENNKRTINNNGKETSKTEKHRRKPLGVG